MSDEDDGPVQDEFSLTDVGWFYGERQLKAPTYTSERIEEVLDPGFRYGPEKTPGSAA